MNFELLFYVAIICWYIFFTTLFSLILSYLLDYISSPRIRILFPAAGGTILYLIFVIVPQILAKHPSMTEAQNPLYSLVMLPFFILAPVPLLEKRTGVIFDKKLVFSGSMITAAFWLFLTDYVVRVLKGSLQTDLPEWTLSAVIVAFLVFSGIFLLKTYYFDISEGDQEDRKPTGIASPPVRRNKGYLIIGVWVFALLLLAYLILVNPLFRPAPCTGFSIDMVDKSLTVNQTVTHLTDNDLRKFPRFGSIITDSQKNSGGLAAGTHTTRTGLGNVQFSCDEQSQMSGYSHFAASSSDPRFYEYNGSFYETGMVWIV